MSSDQFSVWGFLTKNNQTDLDNHLSLLNWTRDVWEDKGPHFYMIISTAICTIFTLLLGLVQSVRVYRYVSVARLRNNLYYIIAMNPISVICCMMGMLMPRNAAFLYGIILTYHMMCIRVALDVLFNISGGRSSLSRHLLINNEKIRFNFFPFCIFYKCMPTFTPTVTIIRRFEMIVAQTCIVRIVLQIVDICVMRETETLSHIWFLISHIISVLSVMIALYVSYAIVELNKENSNKFGYGHLFWMVDWSQTLLTIQKTTLDCLSFFTKLPSFIMPIELQNISFYGSIFFLMFIFSIEVLLMQIIITILVRPSVSYLFDSYSTLRNIQPSNYMYLDDSSEGHLMTKDMNSAMRGENEESSGHEMKQSVESGASKRAPDPNGAPSARATVVSSSEKKGVTPMMQSTMDNLSNFDLDKEPTKKIEIVPDTGDYENLKSQSARSMFKELNQANKTNQDFYQLPSNKNGDPPPLLPPSQ